MKLKMSLVCTVLRLTAADVLMTPFFNQPHGRSGCVLPYQTESCLNHLKC